LLELLCSASDSNRDRITAGHLPGCHFHLFVAVEGNKVPDFTAESLDHQTFGLSDYSGKIVVLFLLTTSNSTGNSSDTGSTVPGRVKAR